MSCKNLIVIFQIWDLIISNKLRNNDKENLINSSQYFRNLLSDKRVLILCRPVFQVLFPNLVQIDKENVFKSFQKCKDEEHFKPFILSSRIICKTWKLNIDLMALKWVGHNGVLKFDNLVDYLINSNYAFSEPQKTERFLLKFDRTHLSSNTNPFIGRSISMSLVPKSEEHLEFFPEISTLFNNYGEHVQKCDLSILNSLSSRQASKVVEWLWAMPNLKRFHFLCDRYSNFTNVRDLPKWKYLNEVILQSVPHAFVKQLFKKNIHITCLNIYGFLNSREESNCLNKLVYLKNLQVLTVDINYPSKFEWLKYVNSTLKTISIFNKFGENKYMRWSQVFENISDKCLNILETLMVELPVARTSDEQIDIMEDSLKYRIIVPNLKKLEVGIKDLASLDFLLGITDSLEELFIRRNTSKEDNLSEKKIEIENAQIIQFVGYETKLLESNIWHIFPKLKAVCLYDVDNKIIYNREKRTFKDVVISM